MKQNCLLSGTYYISHNTVRMDLGIFCFCKMSLLTTSKCLKSKNLFISRLMLNEQLSYEYIVSLTDNMEVLML